MTEEYCEECDLQRDLIELAVKVNNIRTEMQIKRQRLNEIMNAKQ